MRTNIRWQWMNRAGLVLTISLATCTFAQAQHLFRRTNLNAGQRPTASASSQPSTAPAAPSNAPAGSIIASNPPAQPQVRQMPVERLQRWWSGTATVSSGAAPVNHGGNVGAAATASSATGVVPSATPGAPVINGASASAYSQANSQTSNAAIAAEVAARPVATTPIEATPVEASPEATAQAAAETSPARTLAPGESRSIFDHLRFAAAPGPRNVVRNFGPHNSGSPMVSGRRPLPTENSTETTAAEGSTPRIAANDLPQRIAAEPVAESSTQPVPSAQPVSTQSAPTEVPLARSETIPTIATTKASSPPPPVRRIGQTHVQQDNAYDLIRALQQAHQDDEPNSAGTSRPISIVASGSASQDSVSHEAQTKPETSSVTPVTTFRQPATAVTAEVQTLPVASRTEVTATTEAAPPPAQTTVSSQNQLGLSQEAPKSVPSTLQPPSFIATAANLEPTPIRSSATDTPANHTLEAKHQSVTRINPADVRLAVYDPRGVVASGEEAIYEIHINNHGPETARNIQVLVTVDPSLTVSSAQGMGAKTAISGVVFDSIPEMAPHTLQILRFSVRATQPGGHQFRVELASTDPRLRQAIEGTTRFGE